MAKAERKTTSLDKLVPKVANAILEGASIPQAGREAGLTDKGSKYLSAAIGASVDKLNEELADRLTTVARKYVDRLERVVDDMPLPSLAYAGLMLIDKASALRGRSNPAGVHVNLQVNNNGMQMSKEDLMDILEGKKKPTTIDATTGQLDEA